MCRNEGADVSAEHRSLLVVVSDLETVVCWKIPGELKGTVWLESVV